MNESTFKGKWNEVKGKVKEQWGDLTNDDLDRIEGRRDQLVGAIQQRYGKARDEAEREVQRFEERNGLR
ncbi:MAG: CsbD family protein [Longimicrobiales bacterium]